MTELKLKVETAERERDFYFEKLRDIEILCQAPELQVRAAALGWLAGAGTRGHARGLPSPA